MVKKLKSLSTEQDKQLANAVRNSAQQIWQAGLGAFAKAQEEGGKVFSKLVKEGTSLQKRTKKMAEEKVSDVTGTVSKVADDMQKQASGTFDKLEHVFEERVARALSSMGVPTQKDIQNLTKRVEQLSKAVAELSGKKSAVVKEEAAKPVKAAVKAAANVAVKPAAKTVTKSATKAATKSAAKPANTKSAASKPAAKPSSKVTPQATSKAAAKPAKVAAVKKADAVTPAAPQVDTPAAE